MPKFAFSIPNVVVLVDAPDWESAHNVIDELPGTRQNLDGTITSVPEHAWLIRNFHGEVKMLHACLVCGCTPDDPCSPRRCSFITNQLCSTDDRAHHALYEAQGVI